MIIIFTELPHFTWEGGALLLHLPPAAAVQSLGPYYGNPGYGPVMIAYVAKGFNVGWALETVVVLLWLL